MNYPVQAFSGTMASIPHPAENIDWTAAMALRQMALAHDALPRYLLSIEVGALLHYIPDLYQQTLIATLWNTGAGITKRWR